MACRAANVAFAVLALALSVAAFAAESTCYGTVASGRLEKGVKLPRGGKNFTAYSGLGVVLGRTYVHSKVSGIVVAAYRELEKSAPDKKFVYGETGWAAGGRIRPHRSHRNGLSVDFMVPVVDKAGRPVSLPVAVSNKFGYGIEFDAQAGYQSYRIDFEAIAEHLYQLHVAARAAGAEIEQVIFDRAYLPKLYATKHGAYLKGKLQFMMVKPWIRHDEHYHVDFAVACKPLQE
jgi:penicillin-insensitive murein endopeptidase